MNSNVTITLVVPVYNVEKYLTQCLESIVAQSVPFDEVILVNDGSTDQSRLICERYVLKYKYIKLINQENKGLSAARNAGMHNAISEYILFLDSDDYLRSDTVVRLKDELRKFRQDAVYFDANIECEKGYEVSQNNFDRNMKGLVGILMSGETFFRKCYPQHYVVPVWLAVYRKEVIEAAKIYFPEGLYYEDVYFTFIFMMQAKRVTYILEKLYQRRYRANSIITSSYSERKFTNIIEIILLVWEAVVRQKDIALPENKIFLKFINDYCGIGLEHRRLCKENNIILRNNAEKEFCVMVKKYELLIGRYCINDNIEYLSILNNIQSNLSNIVMYCSKYKIQTEKIIKKISGRRKQFYKRLLFDIPLNVEGRKIGIYGTGKHTEGFIAAYRDLIGEITCNLFFIDSYKNNGEYLNKNIIHYRQIDSSFDLIIISSFRYEQEMIENVRSISKRISVHTFYNILEEDVFSRWDL